MHNEGLTRHNIDLAKSIPAGTRLSDEEYAPIRWSIYFAGGDTQCIQGEVLVFWSEDIEAVAAARAQLLGQQPIEHTVSE